MPQNRVLVRIRHSLTGSIQMMQYCVEVLDSHHLKTQDTPLATGQEDVNWYLSDSIKARHILQLPLLLHWKIVTIINALQNNDCGLSCSIHCNVK